ncbi:DNA-binding MarR family transcriptional regulator [Pseudorhodobacter sp. 4114]|nr:DNA-binding MarR family transcriptional regulator [Pseudorhodobacter sp. 4114]
MPSVSNLTDHTGYLMRLVSNAVSQDFACKVAAIGVTVAEWAFLRVLFDTDGIAPTALADKMGMTRGAISKLADRLLAKGLIRRSDSQTDRRAQVLALTTQGRNMVPDLARLADENDAETFGLLTTAERAALDQILKTLIERRSLTTTALD